MVLNSIRTWAILGIRKIVRVADLSAVRREKGKVSIMATLVIDRGVFCIRWIENKERKTISLSGKKFSRKTVDELCRIVEKLLYFKSNPIEVPDKRTKVWLESADKIILQKLANANLIELPPKSFTGTRSESFGKCF